MIKKMMALLAAISCAIGAWADVSEHLSGTDFSTHPVGTFETQHDDAGNPIDVDHHTYWFTGDPDFEGTIVTNALEEKFLDFESNITNPLYRTISICDDAGSPTNFVTTPIGSGLFIDTHVQFTPYLVNENHPAPEAVTTDDKLIVWVRETEVDGGPNVTNLIVTAGYFDDGGNVSASNYVATLSSAYVSDLCSDACRLTIKSYENVTRQSGAYVMGFVVYIDEVAIGYEGDAFDDDCVLITAGLKTNPAQYYTQGGATNKLFLSLLPAASSSANSKLSGVGYAGMGKIGDVYFDDYDHIVPDFAKDARAFTVEMGDGVESFMYNNVPYNTSTNLTAPSTVASVTISNVTYLSGWKHKDDTWRNGNDQVVSNRVGAAGDYGTFYFADGDVFTLVGFQPNYQVVVGGVTNEYQTLYGTGGALAAALSAGNLILNRDIVISEGSGDFAGCLLLEEGTLTIDLNGHTIKGTGVATIINLAGTLTINDSSAGQTGKVLNSDLGMCLYVAAGTTTLNAGTFETITTDTAIVINGGTYLDDGHTPDADDFYLQAYVASGDVTWDQVGGHWYATVGGSVATTWDITFSTNNVVVTEWNLTVNDGSPIGNHIPNFTGGSWDAPAPTAETVVNSNTNFNYTIPGPSDPWAPTAETDEAAAAKIADLFPGTEVAANVTTYAMYTNLVDYIKGVTSQSEVPGDITDAQEPWLWKSYILGANPLFVTNAVVAITSLDVGENAGEWDFVVKVTEGELTTAHSVAAAKVAALVKVTDSLSPASWSAPDPEDVHADLAPLLGTNLIKVTVDFGTDTSGFMKVSE